MSWKFILIVVALIGGSIGYYLWHQVPDTPKEQTPAGYIQNLQRSEQKAKDAVSTANLQDVQNAVEKYKTEKGAFPPSLQDLVPQFLDHVPGGFQYDPATGVVSVAQ